MIGIDIKEIQGKQVNYLKLTAEQGYCFYNADDEERSYMTTLTTPIIGIAELERKYIAVVGDAEKLNEELQKEREALDNGENR